MGEKQNEINRAEWSNPDNWSGLPFHRAYFSKRDSRLIVPQSRLGLFGPMTINLGHRWGFAFLTMLYCAVVAGFFLLGWQAAK
jgi:uncharacterized membrane protein